jgi:hypothetical protein
MGCLGYAHAGTPRRLGSHEMHRKPERNRKPKYHLHVHIIKGFRVPGFVR